MSEGYEALRGGAAWLDLSARGPDHGARPRPGAPAAQHLEQRSQEDEPATAAMRFC